ncbi:MAG: hypothetical protein HETSPECPRED_005034 [Heterodermia speciosa]|uniref:Uncharacterized protein n=1 Tax=Heterodermia speciosa TaxID=116794 RepID=A0A8H3FDA1_9LECA|nr:MAG: hypothetical protein HETSPECPRED_005034 [Heterodermia speciosa]
MEMKAAMGRRIGANGGSTESRRAKKEALRTAEEGICGRRSEYPYAAGRRLRSAATVLCDHPVHTGSKVGDYGMDMGPPPGSMAKVNHWHLALQAQPFFDPWTDAPKNANGSSLVRYLKSAHEAVV